MDTLELPKQLQGDMVDVEKLRREILSQLLSKVQSRTASLVEQLLDCGAPLMNSNIQRLVSIVWQKYVHAFQGFQCICTLSCA